MWEWCCSTDEKGLYLHTGKMYTREISKRRMKNFTMVKWREMLANKDWNEILNCGDLDGKVDLFNTAIQDALDEIAPVRSFKVCSHHKFGLSEQTK